MWACGLFGQDSNIVWFQCRNRVTLAVNVSMSVKSLIGIGIDETNQEIILPRCTQVKVSWIGKIFWIGATPFHHANFRIALIVSAILRFNSNNNPLINSNWITNKWNSFLFADLFFLFFGMYFILFAGQNQYNSNTRNVFRNQSPHSTPQSDQF